MPRERTGRVDRHGRGWRFQVYVDGQRIRRTFGTRKDAQDALEALLFELDRDATADLARKLGRLSVADLLALYRERRWKDLELSTRARYDGVYVVQPTQALLADSAVGFHDAG